MKAIILIMCAVSCIVQAEESNAIELLETEIKDRPKPSTIMGANLIIGGTTANPGEYPWFVKGYFPPLNTDGRNLVAEDNTRVCGGTLVTKDMVITAAHCNFQ